MSVKGIFQQFQTLLESKAEFKKRVSIWDYSILDLALPCALILKPGAVAQTIDAYGNQWLRRVVVVVEAYAFYAPADSTGSVMRLLDIVDAIDTLLIENYHLGLTVAEVQRAQIVGISDADIISRGVGGNKWFHVTIAVAADEPEAGSGGAQ